ncbi:MAG: alpha/beta fold hydrolase [Acidimicrobiales bacterium]
MEHGRVRANRLDFAYLDDGPADGPLALCLHGFPDTAHTWRHLLPRLAGAGFHAVAPHLRGYAPTAVPEDGRYDTGTLAIDACELHRALGGGEDAVLIGHDWGAFAAYGAAAAQPERWHRVVTAAVPPPAALAEGFLQFDQLRRSWYIFFFQTPLAEHAVSLDGYAFIDRLWADWSPGFDGSWDTARVKEALASPEHLSAAIGYYRAMFAGPPDDQEAAAAQAAAGTTAPQATLYLHGADDGCMGIDTVGSVTDHLAPGSAMVVVEGAGHFLHLERPDLVGDHIIEFVTA